MTKSKCLLVLCCALACFGQGARAAPDNWVDQACELRLAIVVQAQPGVLDRRPVIVPWARIAAALDGAKVRLSSLRLIAAGEPVPFQIDHRDPGGDLLPPGNLTLDPQDELVFVCPTDRQTTLHLYGSTEPMPPVVFPAGVEVAAIREGGGRTHYKMSSGGLKIGIQGAGALDLNATTPINLGRGCVVELVWQGQSAIWPTMNWAIFMNGHPYAIDRWRTVKLVVDGPVRTVIAAHGVGTKVKDKDGTIVRQADVTRYFSMFADVPLYDIEDVVRCTQVQPTWTLTYADRFFAGRGLDANDVLWDGSAGTTRQFVLADKDIKTNRNGGLVGNKEVDAGWCAWYDTEEKSGLAVFYRPVGVKVASVGFESGWEYYSAVNRMSFVYDGLQAPTTLRHRFRIVGLAEVHGAEVAAEHSLWADDAGGSVAIGELERSR